MAYNDPIGDMFTRIRNAQTAKHSATIVPASKMRASVLDLLKAEGFIRGYKQETSEAGHGVFRVELKYAEDGEGVIHELQRVSRPGRRVYSKVNEIPRIHNGLGIAIMSTPHGVLSDYQARAENVGGEVIGKVF
tara:strand:- start:1316 stop:1717 length:402 start_codon:yes stop_codon:yes gene_type:complete